MFILKDADTSRAATEPAENTETISEQTLTIVIEPQGVELYDGVSAESEDVVLWDETAYTENLPKETSVSAAKPEKDTTPKTGI